MSKENEELKKVGEEFEKWKKSSSREPDITKIFSNPKWKIAKLTFSIMGKDLTSGACVAVEPEKNLFYNNILFQGRIIPEHGERQIEYEVLTQKEHEELLKTNRVSIAYTQYTFKDCV
jgi:hypothetical protein